MRKASGHSVRAPLSSIVHGSALLFMLASLLPFAESAAQTSSDSGSSSSAVSAPSPRFANSGPDLPDNELINLPRDAYNAEPDYAVPESRLFKNTLLPVPRGQALAPRPTINGDSLREQVSFELPDVQGQFPIFQRGFEPKDADLKIGPVFFKLREASTTVLVSDNINLTETNRQTGEIAIAQFSIVSIVQLTEDIHLSLGASLIYLPLQGRFGYSGLTTQSLYAFGLVALPFLRSQFTWDTNIAGVPVVFADDFRFGIGHYDISARDDGTLFEIPADAEVDRAGRYTFRAPAHNSRTATPSSADQTGDFSYFGNTVSATTERLLPGDIRLRVHAYNENLFYNQGNRGMPSMRDGLSVLVKEADENVRFKPYVLYDAFYTDAIDGITQTVRLGVEGPITDQLQLDANVGYLNSPAGGNDFLWTLRLEHAAGPYTDEDLVFTKTLSDFNDETITEAAYSLRQVLGPRLLGRLFTSYSQIADLEGQFGTRDFYRAGININFQAGPRTEIDAIGFYSRLMSGQNDYGNSDTWTGRIRLTYRFSDTFFGRLLYQYQSHDSSLFNRSYYENLVEISLIKRFD